MDIKEAKKLWSEKQEGQQSRWDTRMALSAIKRAIDVGKEDFCVSLRHMGLRDITPESQFTSKEILEGTDALRALGYNTWPGSSFVNVSGWASQESEAKNED